MRKLQLQQQYKCNED